MSCSLATPRAPVSWLPASAGAKRKKVLYRRLVAACSSWLSCHEMVSRSACCVEYTSAQRPASGALTPPPSASSASTASSSRRLASAASGPPRPCWDTSCSTSALSFSGVDLDALLAAANRDPRRGQPGLPWLPCPPPAILQQLAGPQARAGATSTAPLRSVPTPPPVIVRAGRVAVPRGPRTPEQRMAGGVGGDVETGVATASVSGGLCGMKATGRHSILFLA
mmetsp:Transcript_35090/g.87949  ORF Transcript_35090/g.87949 Transcript_35090/m.87949 type:complete len:224 (-) Transcript_35090:866-1537(-)